MCCNLRLASICSSFPSYCLTHVFCRIRSLKPLSPEDLTDRTLKRELDRARLMFPFYDEACSYLFTHQIRANDTVGMDLETSPPAGEDSPPTTPLRRARRSSGSSSSARRSSGSSSTARRSARDEFDSDGDVDVSSTAIGLGGSFGSSASSSGRVTVRRHRLEQVKKAFQERNLSLSSFINRLQQRTIPESERKSFV